MPQGYDETVSPWAIGFNPVGVKNWLMHLPQRATP